MASQDPSAVQPSPTLPLEHYLDLAISLPLHLWPALTLAVREEWGGPDSATKRDWLGGAISELFSSRPDTDEQDVEDVLLQVLGDEFECQLEDESEVMVASQICRLRRQVLNGKLDELEGLQRRWEEAKSKGGEKGNFQVVSNKVDGEDVDEEDSEEDDDEDEEGGAQIDEDIEMEDAPALAPAKTKVEPEVDEEGFTKVVGKKRR